MTLPALIAKYQMRTYEVAFKKQYSVIQNTLNYLGQEEGISECYTYYDSHSYLSKVSQCSDMTNALISKLKLSVIKNDFKDIYKPLETVLAQGGKSTNDSVNYHKVYQNTNAYLLPDGAIILMHSPESSAQHYYRTAIIIDVNGKKGPNKWGYDVFYMSFTKKENSQNITLDDSYGTLVEKGGLLPRTILRNENENTDYSTTFR